MNGANETLTSDTMTDFITVELAAAARNAGKLAWSAANDNRRAVFCNGVISVSVVALDVRWVVSVFFCGAGGLADTDRGEHSVQEYASRDEAMRMFKAWRAVAWTKAMRVGRRARMGV